MIGECSICKEEKEIKNIANYNSDVHAVAISMDYSVVPRDLCDDCINKLKKEKRIMEKNKIWQLWKTEMRK